MSVLEIRDLVVRFGTGPRAVTAVDHLDLSVGAGSIVGLVGESGSGKSTLARAVVGLVPLAAGEILLDGEPIRTAAGRPRRELRERGRLIQMVFQDPYASLNPRMSIGESVAEGIAAGRRADRSARQPDVRELLERVRLNPDDAHVLPRQLSGGQRQRVALARALAARPEILIADEISSALDVSVQGAVLNLLREIHRETGIGVLFISHNLAVVRYLSDRMAVMSGGRIVETGPTEQVTEHPRAPYTKALISAVPGIAAGAGGISRRPAGAAGA
ncbi:ABC transporter ATP-binding protein [Streptomyces sp. CA-111067]|uniref:ABC transporter ATP-binding protein n=1 Tax=Streptomyces sp. CA-111067 TaxID=3240046 RepID=UPI003D99FD53